MLHRRQDGPFPSVLESLHELSCPWRLLVFRPQAAHFGTFWGDIPILFFRLMTSIFRSIDALWAIHPHLVELILFCLAVFVSIFPERSRRFVVRPVQYSALGMIRFMQRDAKNQLEIMRIVEDSAFKLVAYIGYYCIHAFLWALGTSLVFVVCLNLVAGDWRMGGHSSVVPFNVLFFGSLLGRTTRLYFFFGGLLNSEMTVKQLEKIAAGERIQSRGAEG